MGDEVVPNEDCRRADARRAMWGGGAGGERWPKHEGALLTDAGCLGEARLVRFFAPAPPAHVSTMTKTETKIETPTVANQKSQSSVANQKSCALDHIDFRTQLDFRTQFEGLAL